LSRKEIPIEVRSEGVEVVGRNTDLGVDPFVRNVDAAKNAELIQVYEELIAKDCGIFDFVILVKGNCRPFFVGLA
jgi:hypothetical protein